MTVSLGGAEIEVLTESAMLSDLEPGEYTVEAADVVDGYQIYTATVTPTEPISVVAGETAGPVTVEYELSSTVMVTTADDDSSVPGSLRQSAGSGRRPRSGHRHYRIQSCTHQPGDFTNRAAAD